MNWVYYFRVDLILGNRMIEHLVFGNFHIVYKNVFMRQKENINTFTKNTHWDMKQKQKQKKRKWKVEKNCFSSVNLFFCCVSYILAIVLPYLFSFVNNGWKLIGQFFHYNIAELKDASMDGSVWMYPARCVSPGCIQLDASQSRRAGLFHKVWLHNCAFLQLLVAQLCIFAQRKKVMHKNTDAQSTCGTKLCLRYTWCTKQCCTNACATL